MRSKASILILLAVLLMILMYFAFDRHASQSLSASQSTQIVIVGPKQDLTAKKLYTTALSLAVKDTNIIWWDKSEGPLTNTKIQYPWLDKSAVYVCHHYECSLPMFDTQELIEFIKHVNTTKQPSSMIHLSQPQAEMNHHDAADHLLKSESWILTVLGFIGIGLLLSFSPCILPLIPIMASIIVGQTIGVKKSRTFLLCLVYVLSMSITYALVGLAAGVFGLYLQVYMQQSWIIILFSMIFLTLSLSMLGAFELKLPHKFQNKLHDQSNHQKGGTFIGVMSMGILATLIVSPCVTAPLAAILSYIAKTSDYMLGAVSLFFLGIGMGMPILIISLFSKNILPKVAHWDMQIRNFFGLVLMGMSIWIVSRVIAVELTFIMWSALIILTSIYMGIYNRSTKKLTAKFWKTLTILVFLFGVSIFFNAMFINSVLYNELMKKGLSADSHVDSKSFAFTTIHNQAELDQYIGVAKRNYTMVFLDFTAKWCIACNNMERYVFNDPVIISQLSKFVLLRVDLTKADPDSMKVAQQFHVIGPPVVIFFDANGELMNMRATGEFDTEQFSQMLQEVLSFHHHH